MSNAIDPLQVELEDFVIDVRRAHLLLWDKYELQKECPICQASEEELVSIHNDALNMGAGGNQFRNKWRQTYEATCLTSHFLHHCKPSTLVTALLQAKKSFEKSAKKTEGFAQISKEELTTIQHAMAGDFGTFYSSIMSGMVRYQQHAEKLFVDSVQQREENDDEETRSEERAAMNQSFKMLSQIAKHVDNIDKRYHDKTHLAIKTYVEWMRMSVIKDIMLSVKQTFDNIAAGIMPKIGQTETDYLFGEAMKNLQARVGTIMANYIDESKQQLKTIGESTK